MKKISNEDDLKNYVFNLERENISLKKSHSYRLGKSLIDIKNKILEKDFKGLNPALKNLVDSTQKVDKNQDHAVISISNITESKIKNINSKNTSSTMNYTINSNVYYFYQKLKIG
ncbi:hypothetical protein [Psychrobacter sp. JCM 18903]|uniref:hypothetical protein n=1 Tax=Psychrobacter sp. JCM 18903 TaxID=1298610 RepID=UPI0005EDD673|nr:hypothetical protein [Psychrobacter sp. JCM 18903]